MTRREKIILAATGLVAVVGLVVLFSGESPVVPPANMPGLQGDAAAQVQILTTSIAAATPSDVDMALLAAVEAPWRLAAVYDKPLEGKLAARAATLPRYTGYVELGSGRLAVVDGYEYQVGDALESGGFKVVAITPDQVTLESLANGTQEKIVYQGQEALAQ